MGGNGGAVDVYGVSRVTVSQCGPDDGECGTPVRGRLKMYLAAPQDCSQILETVHCWRYFQDTRYQLVIKSPQGLPALGISRIWAILGSLGSVFNSGGARRRLLGKLGVP